MACGYALPVRAHRELLLNYFRARKAFSSGVVEGLNNKAKVSTNQRNGERVQGLLVHRC